MPACECPVGSISLANVRLLQQKGSCSAAHSKFGLRDWRWSYPGVRSSAAAGPVRMGFTLTVLGTLPFQLQEQLSVFHPYARSYIEAQWG